MSQVPALLEQLSLFERDRLDELEAVIERGLQTFVDVGLALSEIRDARLYRETHPTFEAYLSERWGMARSRGYQLIDAARVSTMVDIPNERQARELVPLLDDEADLVEIVLELRAEHGEQLTATKVRQAVDERLRRDQVLTYMGSSVSDDWHTPQKLFDRLDAEFHFETDVCADAGNAKCRHYYTPGEDGLRQDWAGTCWMNPPYGATISDWIAKAAEAAKGGATVVCLVPARVDAAWWQDYCAYAEIRFLRGRLTFANAESTAPFPSAVVIFGREPNTVNAHWDWRAQ